MNKIRHTAIELRKLRKLSQADLAEMVGVEQPTISRFEQGGDSITLRLINQIAEALDVQVHDLFATSNRDADEDLLVSVFRTLSEDRRQGWMDMIRAAKAGAGSKDQ